MSICWTLVTVLLLILPAVSQLVKTTCKIPSVEAGDDATLTTYFDINFTNEESTDFYVSHFGHNATVSQVMLRCIFSSGDVECDNKTCCTWERHVTNVFRVYIHNVSQEHEGRFWGFVSPADMREQKYCNFTLKASTCPTDVINVSNSHKMCNNQTVTIGHTCTVTCIPGHYFQENQNSVTYTCVGKNKWSPEISITSCEAKGQSANMYFLLLLIVIPVVIVMAILFKKWYTQNKEKNQRESNASNIEENMPLSDRSLCDVEKEVSPVLEENMPLSDRSLCDVEKEVSPVLDESLPRSDRSICDVEREKSPDPDESLPRSDRSICDVEREKSPDPGILLPIKPNQIQTAPQEATKYWLECINTWYPELRSRTYFLPPFQFNYVQYREQNVAGYMVPVPQITEDSDVFGDRALQSVLKCLQVLSDKPHHTDNSQQTEISSKTDIPQQNEVMMVIYQLQFGKYRGEPSYAAAATLAPQPNLLSGQFRPPYYYDKGDCDVLIIHKSLGLLTLQISSVGGNFNQPEMTNEEKDDLVMKKVKQLIEHLNKAEVVLKTLTPEITHITKILVLPYISSCQLQRVINMNTSIEKFLCECLGAKSVVDAVKLCLLSDQLSGNVDALKQCLLSDQLSDNVDAVNLCLLSDQLTDYNQTPSDINQILREWWQDVRASRSGSSLTPSLYEQLVARFCGPATTVEVHCVTAPRLNIRTLGGAVSETGERVARLVLFPQQVEILNQSPPRAFLSGPPGTGKTIVLIMQGLTWIQRGYDVHVVSTWDESRAVTFVIEHQLQETAKTITDMPHIYRHHFALDKEIEEVELAVGCLKSLREGRQMCVIADEVVSDDREPFTQFCDQLIDDAYIWGASMYHDVSPSRLDEFILTAPLRSPPVVIREVMKAEEIKDEDVYNYTVSDVPAPTDGPPVIIIKHRDGQSSHTENWPLYCVECGHEVDRVLRKLEVGRTGYSNAPPPLQYRDVLVLCFDYPTDSNGQGTTTANGLVRGLRDCGVPVRVVKKGDEDAILDMALGVGDLVTVANWRDVHGLERKVVVVDSGIDVYVRLYLMSRCTSQLVVIDR